MTTPKLIISPKTKVGELLDNFPYLESVLMEMSPAFEKLKNPVLRKTVARVATIQQIAVVGRLNIDMVVNRLREKSGQGAGGENITESEYLSDVMPDWFDESKISSRLDASPIINSGGSPLNEILRQTNLLKPGEIFELRTPFIPAPIIDMLKAKDFKIHCAQIKNFVISFISR